MRRNTDHLKAKEELKLNTAAAVLGLYGSPERLRLSINESAEQTPTLTIAIAAERVAERVV